MSPSAAAEQELHWFFNEAARAITVPSNFVGLISCQPAMSLEAVEHRIEAQHAAGKIHARLLAVSTADALILEGLHTERLWPRAVRRALGELAGPVAALPTVKVAHLRALATDRTQAMSPEEWLVGLVAGGEQQVRAWRREAREACARASRAYDRVRGDGASVVPEGDPDASAHR